MVFSVMMVSQKLIKPRQFLTYTMSSEFASCEVGPLRQMPQGPSDKATTHPLHRRSRCNAQVQGACYNALPQGRVRGVQVSGFTRHEFLDLTVVQELIILIPTPLLFLSQTSSHDKTIHVQALVSKATKVISYHQE
jgi:hypothetical protein